MSICRANAISCALPRGGVDVAASRYGVRVKGATEIALTKLVVLAGYGEIPVCTHYDVDGVITANIPSGGAQERAQAEDGEQPGVRGPVSQHRTLPAPFASPLPTEKN